jgi:hypothetical protein
MDDIIILYNHDKIQEEQILLNINSIDKNLQFKITTEEHRNTVSGLNYT